MVMLSKLLKIRLGSIAIASAGRKAKTALAANATRNIKTATADTAAVAGRKSPVVSRFQSSSSKSTSSSETSNKKIQEAAPKADSSSSTAQYPRDKKGFLYRMAPPKGGTDPPDAKFMAVASVVVLAGAYAWIIEPPEPYVEKDEKTSPSSN